jgi:hypothetical protein
MKHIKEYKNFHSLNEGFKELLVATAMSLGLITNAKATEPIIKNLTPTEYCKSIFNDSTLEKAKDFWKNWLNDSSTISKIANLHKTTEEEVRNNYVPKWLKIIEPIHIKYEEFKDNTIAEVDHSLENPFVYVNMSSKVFSERYRNKYEIEGVRILVHELQHKMSELIPINPKEVVDYSFGKQVYVTGWINKMFPKEMVERVGKEFGISDLNEVKSKLYTLFSMAKKNDLKYTITATEMTSRIDGIRYEYGIKPSEKGLKPKMFKDTFLKIKYDPDKDWILILWSKYGYPPFQEFLNGLEILASNTKKLDNNI